MSKTRRDMELGHWVVATGGLALQCQWHSIAYTSAVNVYVCCALASKCLFFWHWRSHPGCHCAENEKISWPDCSAFILRTVQWNAIRNIWMEIKVGITAGHQLRSVIRPVYYMKMKIRRGTPDPHSSVAQLAHRLDVTACVFPVYTQLSVKQSTKRALHSINTTATVHGVRCVIVYDT